MFNYSDFKYLIIIMLLILHCCREIAGTSNMSARIVGGQTTTIQNIKFLVNLRTDGKFTCGGSLVTTTHVVTAAHCVQGVSARSIIVVGGVTYLSESGVRRSVTKVVIPKTYNKDTFHMDVAVLKLSSPMTGADITTIGLCNDSWQPGNKVQVSGWGVTSENSKTESNQVRTVSVSLISKSSCSQKYRSVARLTNTMFCASVPGSKDSCEGDSGGPVVHKGRLCGIVSWGVGCARAKYPGIYTNVNTVSSFIKSAMKK